MPIEQSMMVNEMNGVPETEPAVAALEYATPRMERPAKYVYRKVIALSGAPMVLGGLALMICWGMRWSWGPDYTALMVLISVFLAGVAGVELWLFARRERRYQRLSPAGLNVRVALAGLLLAGNGPMLWLYAKAPQHLTRRTTLTVINNGPAVVDRFVVSNAGVKSDIGPVGQGATVTGKFDVPMGKYLSFEAWQTRGNSRSMSGGSMGNGKGEYTITMTTAGMSIK